jgi:hypothetical protein
LFHRHRKEFPLGLEGVKGLADVFQTSLTAMGIRYATLCTEPVAVVVSEGDLILYSVLSKPFASELGVESRRTARSRDLPAKSVTWRLNAGGKVVSEERDIVKASEWFPKADGELAEEVIGLGRYGKTFTVLSMKPQNLNLRSRPLRSWVRPPNVKGASL